MILTVYHIISNVVPCMAFYLVINRVSDRPIYHHHHHQRSDGKETGQLPPKFTVGRDGHRLRATRSTSLTIRRCSPPSIAMFYGSVSRLAMSTPEPPARRPALHKQHVNVTVSCDITKALWREYYSENSGLRKRC